MTTSTGRAEIPMGTMMKNTGHTYIPISKNSDWTLLHQGTARILSRDLPDVQKSSSLDKLMYLMTWRNLPVCKFGHQTFWQLLVEIDGFVSSQTSASRNDLSLCQFPLNIEYECKLCICIIPLHIPTIIATSTSLLHLHYSPATPLVSVFSQGNIPITFIVPPDSSLAPSTSPYN